MGIVESQETTVPELLPFLHIRWQYIHAHLKLKRLTAANCGVPASSGMATGPDAQALLVSVRLTNGSK